MLSVIVPVFRVEKYLDKCVQSLLAQTYKELEIILVDDGSDDGCPAMCDSYANMDSQDHAYKGAVMARNILDSLDVFSEEEKNLICTAIYNHSNKSIVHESLDEILKDADVMQHVLYNPLFEVKQHEQDRYNYLKTELSLEN